MNQALYISVDPHRNSGLLYSRHILYTPLFTFLLFFLILICDSTTEEEAVASIGQSEHLARRVTCNRRPLPVNTIFRKTPHIFIFITLLGRIIGLFSLWLIAAAPDVPPPKSYLTNHSNNINIYIYNGQGPSARC